MKKWLMKIKVKIKYKINTLFWLKVLNSPFKGLRFRVYFGKIQHGTPYFLPRKWVKFNKQDALEKAIEDTNNERLSNYGEDPFILAKYYMHYSKAIQIKWFGINTTSLGYKTKWSDTDYRFEWSPLFSLVLCYTQLVIWVTPKVDCNMSIYWEAWLVYNYHTDKTLSVSERLLQLFEIYGCTWTSYSKNGNETTDYYYNILDQKYIKVYEQWKLNKL